MGRHETGGQANGVAVSGNYAYVANSGAGLQVINVSAPAQPQRVGGYNTSGHAWSVAVSEHYAYVADGSAGLQVIDISNPRNLNGWAARPTTTPKGVAVSGNYAYVGAEFVGLQVTDVGSGPSSTGGRLRDRRLCRRGGGEWELRLRGRWILGIGNS